MKCEEKGKYIVKDRVLVRGIYHSALQYHHIEDATVRNNAVLESVTVVFVVLGSSYVKYL